MTKKHKIECPSLSAMFDCPYYKNGLCTMREKEGTGPAGECDDYDYYMSEEDNENE